jgi:hypothetical protein
VALGRAAYNVIAIINNFLTPLSTSRGRESSSC